MQSTLEQAAARKIAIKGKKIQSASAKPNEGIVKRSDIPHSGGVPWDFRNQVPGGQRGSLRQGGGRVAVSRTNLLVFKQKRRLSRKTKKIKRELEGGKFLGIPLLYNLSAQRKQKRRKKRGDPKRTAYASP